MKKRLLFVINTLGLAGAEVALLGLLSAIPQDEYDIDLMVLMNQGELIDRIPSHVHLLGDTGAFVKAPIHSKEGAKAMTSKVLSALFAKGQIFTNFGYLLANTFKMINEGAGLKKDKLLWKCLSDSAPRIDTEYDAAIAYIEGGSTYYVADHVKAKKKYSFVHISYELTGYNSRLDHGCYEKIDRIFTVSDEVKKSFLNYYPRYEKKVSVFHNIIDAQSVVDRAKDTTERDTNEKWLSHSDDFRIVTVGRLNYQKGYDMAVSALGILKDRGIRAFWYVVGDGELGDELMASAKSLGVEDHFIILGRKENPYPYVSGADLYVQPSRFEGKSIAIEEAKILCAPMVITRCDGNMEQLMDGVNGMYCDMTSEAIAEAIAEMYGSKEKRDSFRNELSKEDRSNNTELVDFLNSI